MLGASTRNMDQATGPRPSRTALHGTCVGNECVEASNGVQRAGVAIEPVEEGGRRGRGQRAVYNRGKACSPAT